MVNPAAAIFPHRSGMAVALPRTRLAERLTGGGGLPRDLRCMGPDRCAETADGLATDGAKPGAYVDPLRGHDPNAGPASGQWSRWSSGGIGSAGPKAGGCRAGTWPRAGGVIRESRPRPYGTPSGGAGGGTGGRGCRAGTWPGRAARFANLDQDPMKRRPVGLAAGPDVAGAGQGPRPGAAGAIRESRTRPYDTNRPNDRLFGGPHIVMPAHGSSPRTGSGRHPRLASSQQTKSWMPAGACPRA
jgi:hypothetical protein